MTVRPALLSSLLTTVVLAALIVGVVVQAPPPAAAQAPITLKMQADVGWVEFTPRLVAAATGRPVATLAIPLVLDRGAELAHGGPPWTPRAGSESMSSARESWTLSPTCR
jgi:hypothetical protein